MRASAKVTLISILALAAIVIVAIGLITGGALDDFKPANKLLEITDQDVDPETTILAKNLLKNGQIDSQIALTLLNDARQQLSGDSLSQAEESLKKDQANSVLQPLVKKLADDFDAGRAAAYSIWIEADDSQAGAFVDLQLNTVPLGRYAIETNRYAITFIQRKGATSKVKVTGVREIHGGTVLRAETATSEAQTRHLHPTQSDILELRTTGG
jgi:hypothetical protein